MEKHEYQNLEPRQLLTADILANFTTVNDGSGVNTDANPPNISVAVGENHLVQFTNETFGIFAARDNNPATGNLPVGSLIENGSLNQFFTDAVGPALVDDDGDAVNLTQPRLLYDSGFDRWHVIAVDNQDLNDDLPLVQGNRIWVATTTSPDPTGDWKSGFIQLDQGQFDADGNIVFLFGTERINLSVDEAGVSMTAQEFTFTLFGKTPVGTAVVGVPQVAYFGGAIETGRAEVVGRGLSNNDIGFEIQVGFDSTIDPQTFPITTNPTVFSLAIDGEPDGDTFPQGRQGDELILTEWTREGTPNVDLGLTQGNSFRIPIDPYREPDVVRQPNDIIRDRDSTLFNSTVAQDGDFLYAVHSVRDVLPDPDTGIPTEQPNAVIRWYKIDTTPEIDPDTGEPIHLVDSGVIRAASNDIDLIDPSIDVGPNGTVAIGYTATGLSLFPSSFASIGVPIAGVDSPLAFNDPTELKAGGSTYSDVSNHFWGRYTATVNDPYEQNSFWTAQQYTDSSGNWAIQTTQFGPTDTNPTIDDFPVDVDHDIHISLIGDNIEVRIGDQFTGDLVGQYDADGVGVLTIDGTGGMDRFFVHIDDLESAAITGSYVLLGDRNDKLFVNTTADTSWDFDGGYGVNVNSGRIIAEGMVEFHAGAGNDLFDLPTSDYDHQHDVFGGDGNDIFIVGQDVTGQLFLDGEAGDDIYNVPATSLPTSITIDDASGTNDQLVTRGTEGVDNIIVTVPRLTVNGIEVDFDDARNDWGIESFSVDALGEDDLFSIQTSVNGVFLFGQDGDDTFNVFETAVLSGAPELVIDGGAGINALNVFQNDALAPATVQVTSDLITNMTNAPVRFSASDGGVFNIDLTGSDIRSDVFEILAVATNNSLVVKGEGFDDRFIFENLIDGTAELIGGEGDDLFETNATSIFDVTIDGSDQDSEDQLYLAMTSGDDTVVVNENEYILNGNSYPGPGASFTNIEDFVIDGLDGDDTFDVNRTTTVARFLGNGGSDVFNVTDLTATTGESVIDIDGGADDNTLNVVRNENSGGDVLVNSASITGMTIAAINYVATGGIFGLVDLTGSAAADSFVVQTLLGSALLRVHGQDGDDSFSVERAPLGNVELFGNVGSDTYRVYVTGDKTRTVTISDPAADAGDDRIEVAFTDGDDDIVVDGTNIGLASDIVVLDPDVETLAVDGLDGDDNFLIVNTVNQNVILDGGEGDDTYEIDAAGTALDSNLFIDDTGSAADTDRLVVSGTAGADTFDVNEGSLFINGRELIPVSNDNIMGVESIAFDGKEDVDTFNINSTTRGYDFLGSEGNDIFNVTDLTVTAGAASINIDGGADDNTLNVVRNENSGGDVLVNSASITGMTIAAINYVATGGIFGMVDLTGSAAADSFVVQTLLGSSLLRVHGQDGDDSFRVERAPLGNVELFGNVGSDTYRVYVTGDKTRTVTISDPAADAGDDRIEVAFTDGDDNIVVDGANIGLASDIVVLDPDVETLAVEGLDGDDNFVVLNPVNATVELRGGEGNDTYEIQASGSALSSEIIIIDDGDPSDTDSILVSGTTGADVFDINEGSVFVNGNLLIPATNDNITGVETFAFDGLEGDDTFNINSTTRGFVFRGSEGNDTFNVTDLTVTTGSTDLFIDGGADNNTLNAVRNESTGGSVVVNSDNIVGMTLATINYVATGGVFGLVDLTGSAVSDTFVVETLLGTSLLRIDGQDGDDFFSVRRAPLGDIELAGSTGSDTYRVFVTGDKTRSVSISDPAAQAGDDRIEVVFTNSDDNVLVDGSTIGLATDTVTVDGEVEILAIEAADGDDLITLVNSQNPVVELLGGDGDDTYNVLASGNALANSDLFIIDSINAENDSLLVTGTGSSDIFDINEATVFVNGNTLIPASNDNIEGIESIVFDGAGSNDTFNINSTTRGFEIRGGDGDDTFNVTDATVTTGAGAINIEGGAGFNELNVVRNEFTGAQVVVNETTLEGMTIATINYSDMSLVDLTGSAAADDFDVQTLLASTLLVIDARAGDDTMLVQRAAAGNVDLIGFTGADNYRVEIEGDKSRLVRISDPGTITGVDRVEVVFTTGDDVIDVSGRTVGLANDLVDVDPAVETLALEALGGDDVFNISSPAHANLELYGQAGDDTYVISDLGALASSILISDSVGAENDTLRVLGTVNLDEFIIDDVAITINGVTLTPATGDNIIGVENVSFDGRGDDDIFRINSTTRGFTYLGSEGNDQFFVSDATVTTGSDSFVIDGGMGNNELFVSRAAILGGAAAGTEIVIEDNRIVGMTIADITYLATDGIFSLIEARGTEGTTAGDDVYDDIFRILTLNENTLLDIRSLAGNDIIDVRAAAAGDVEMDGGLGDDRFLVALGGNVDRTVTVDDSGVNEGFDRLDVFFSDADETIVVNNVLGDITYAVGNSEVVFDSTLESLALHALGGNDRYVVNGTTTDELILAGGEGDDTYELSNVFGTTAVSVIDSVNAENDRLTVDGTNDADTFIINENSFLINGNPFIVDDVNANIVGVESIEVDGLDGDDTFIINSATRGFRLLGGAGNDHFEIHDTAGDGGFDDLVIDAGTGVNTMNIQRIAGLPEFVVVQDNYIRNVAKATIRYSATGGSFSGGNGGISITGLDDVNDAFLVFGLFAENSLELLGVGGNDYHRITDNVAGDVWMDAAAGRDRYVFFMDENKVRDLRVADSGTDDSIDRINVFLTENSDNVVLSGPEVAVFEDRMSFNPTIETIEILAGDGDDDIDLQQFDGVRFLRIKGEQGNDTLRVNGARNVENVFLIGEVGNDTFDLVSASEAGYLSANGNEGEDFIRMGEDFYRDGILNGGEEDDRYDVSFADRGTRRVVLADTGATSNDTAIVRATDVSTLMTLRASGINSPNQLIGTTRQIESLELIGTEGADVINMFSAPVVNMDIKTLTGSDSLNINSNNGTETLNVDLGAEADVANITATAPGSTTTINLGRDDDLVNLGSSLAADSGNLDRILGSLSFDFGQGSDRLIVNDSQSGGSHRYLLNDSSVSNDASVSTRGFVGVSYSNAEFMQLRANASFSRVQVTPSSSVRYLLDGNLPQANELSITGSGDGRQLFATGDFAGTWTFDSLRDVQFNQFAI